MLKSRALAYAFTATPFIITAFGGPAAAESLLPNATESPSHLDPVWRWSFGSLAMALPLVVAPLYGIIFYYERRAAALHGTRPEQHSTTGPKTMRRHVLDTMIKFDGENVPITF